MVGAFLLEVAFEPPPTSSIALLPTGQGQPRPLHRQAEIFDSAITLNFEASIDRATTSKLTQVHTPKHPHIMSIHRSRASFSEEYTEYRQFFSVLASGDRSLYATAQAPLSSRKSSSSTSQPKSRPPRLQLTVQTQGEDQIDSSDPESPITPVSSHNLTSVSVVVPESPHAEFKSAPTELGDTRHAYAGCKVAHAAIEEVCRGGRPNESLPLPGFSGSLATTTPAPSTSSQAQSTATQALGSEAMDAFLSDLDAVFPITDSAEDELAAPIKRVVKEMHSLGSFRNVVRQIIRRSQDIFVPLQEAEARRERATGAVSAESPTTSAANSEAKIFAGINLEPKPTVHAPKKRCTSKPSQFQGADTLVAEGRTIDNAQRLMDIVTDAISTRPKIEMSTFKKTLLQNPKNWLKPTTSKKRIFDDLEA